MGPRPFTLQQATSIINDFKHLVGQPFAQDTDMTIQYIGVAPFDQENRDIFVENYKRFGNRPDELDGYVGHFYDVLVFARSEAENDVRCEHIRAYARDNGHPYVFPEYPFN